jgi:hypothetical protein
LLLALVTCQDNGKKYVNVKGEYHGKEGEFGIFFLQKNKICVRFEPPTFSHMSTHTIYEYLIWQIH